MFPNIIKKYNYNYGCQSWKQFIKKENPFKITLINNRLYYYSATYMHFYTTHNKYMKPNCTTLQDLMAGHRTINQKVII